ncbi:unnamed protein product [Rotaria magnacalcarata]|uniref:Uncharacterized protein n=1 Tax=Rotaria magnacalcarata TaxID=392030 RepID=A0A816SFN3_9BILA|nr:unnamed protein product [Rotaria magnacalcarata]CAF4008688.1 unnamed protein product [Rotaria magnacalcarata]CAF4073571.1 unnamed protein product [Rotaria magnacalcarata]
MLVSSTSYFLFHAETDDTQYLEYNKIDDECAQHFADSLRKNKTLQELMLSNNQISSTVQEHLKQQDHRIKFLVENK